MLSGIRSNLSKVSHDFNCVFRITQIEYISEIFATHYDVAYYRILEIIIQSNFEFMTCTKDIFIYNRKISFREKGFNPIVILAGKTFSNVFFRR